MAGPGSGADRYLGPDLFRSGALWLTCGARRAACCALAALAGRGAGWRRDDDARGLRRRAAGVEPDALRRGRATSHYATQSAARREVQLFAEAGSDATLSCAIGGARPATIDRLWPCHRSHLARIGLSLFSPS